MTTKKTAMVIRSVARYRRRAWMASQTLDAARNHEEPEDLEKGGSHGRRSHKKEYDLTGPQLSARGKMVAIERLPRHLTTPEPIERES